MGFIEINLDTTNHDVKKQITDETKTQLKHCSTTLVSSNIPAENFYKSGGVMSISQGDTLGHKITEGCNPLGQWVFSNYAAKDNLVITVVVTYQPF
eukprot:15359081-Ditylum_brightwellii.AAC.1